jgi:acyl-CoA thioesterase FadM
MGESSIAFRYIVRNVTDGAQTMCADGRVVCAVVDLARFVAVPVPARLTEILADLVQA